MYHDDIQEKLTHFASARADISREEAWFDFEVHMLTVQIYSKFSFLAN